jgi:hypothetical protein
MADESRWLLQARGGSLGREEEGVVVVVVYRPTGSIEISGEATFRSLRSDLPLHTRPGCER